MRKIFGRQQQAAAVAVISQTTVSLIPVQLISTF